MQTEMRTHLDALQEAPAWLEWPERLLLYTLVLALRPQRVLEIGTLNGGSALIIALALDAAGQGSLVCLDPQPALLIDWQTIAHRATLLPHASPQGLTEAHACAGGAFDFAFIDGDHSVAGVKADVHGVLPYLAADGYLLFHDAHHPPVRRALDELAGETKTLTDCGLLARASKEEPNGSWGGMRLFRASGRSG